ncbi:hypothetical protein QQG09_09005 [Melissococcus plutonius]|uniref:hypothetical protein n=1 Tax=Melissococcus plutonius TaxID=33970 RepID=UPI0021E59D7F|nr:hypothetical protein [Melissococcus plutonius]MCV2505644.1 hypothetical protein [Melissococcus plutonius]
MFNKKRMMEKDSKGVQRQYYPVTHVSAVTGLEKIISGGSKVLSVNGKTGVVLITKEDLGLTNAITELPYASKEQDGIITAELFDKINHVNEHGALLPATSERLGAVIVGDLLTITENGTLAAKKQTDINFTESLKNKLDSLKNYSAGANITITDEGVISATGGSVSSNGVNQAYVDQGDKNTLELAKKYTESKIPSFIFEKIGEV